MPERTDDDSATLESWLPALPHVADLVHVGNLEIALKLARARRVRLGREAVRLEHEDAGHTERAAAARARRDLADRRVQDLDRDLRSLGTAPAPSPAPTPTRTPTPTPAPAPPLTPSPARTPTRRERRGRRPPN